MRRWNAMDWASGLRLRSLAALAAVLALASPAQADAEVRKGPAAAWVEEVALPSADPASLDRVQNGIAYLLADTQFKRTADGYAIWDRFAYTVTERTGLEQGAAISLAFDPSREKVTINRITVIRDGVGTDRTADAAIDVFRREKRAEQGIFDGWLTASINLPNIRVGDTIDYAVTYEDAPVFPGAPFRDRFAIAWTTPIAAIRRKVIWPTDEPLQIKATGTDVQPMTRVQGEDTVRLWEFRNPTPYMREDNTPPGTPGVGLVEISSAKEWREIAASLEEAYKPVERLPAEFEAKLDAIAARFPTPEERLVEATRLVQDEIRYVSLSIGTGSYLPRAPQAVLESGLGDCKDKALLLASALKHLGVKASVALTDLDEGRALDTLLPSAGAFDHAVVKAEIGLNVYWIDATNYLQGGRADRLAQADYGFALPVAADTRGLEPMTPKRPTEPTTHVFERFALPENEGEPVHFAVTTVYRDADADAVRRRLAEEARAATSERYEGYYSDTYPGMKSTAPLTVSDDREANVVTVVERYEQPYATLHENDFIKSFPLRLDLGQDRLPRPAAADRKAPVWLGRPLVRRHTVTVENLKAAFTPPEDGPVSSSHLSLEMKPTVTASTFELEWTLRTQAELVPPADLATYLAAIEAIRSNDGMTYDFTYADPLPVEPAREVPRDELPVEEPAANGSDWKSGLDAFLEKAAKAKPLPESTN